MMTLSRILATLAVVIALTARGGDAFAPSNNSQNTRMIPSTVVSTTTAAAPSTKSSTSLYGRKWNFNEGQSPWGLKKNGEIWNGRVAQVC